MFPPRVAVNLSLTEGHSLLYRWKHRRAWISLFYRNNRYQNFFFLQIHRLSATIAALTAMIAGYPYRQCSSGIPEKFIPYQPAISDKGRKIVVTIVKICIMRF